MAEAESWAHAQLLRTRDVVGRDVLGAEGRKIGSVKELLLEGDARTVRFVVVDLGLLRNQVLVPALEVEAGPEAMVLRRWTGEEVKALPRYDPDEPLTAELLEEMELAHPRRYGDLRDAPPAPAEGGIVPLKQAKGFRLVKGQPDPTGWDVFGADGERVGVVSGLLVDPVAGRVRYLDVDLLDDLFTLDEDRHVLVPLEVVELKERGEDAWLRDVPAAAVARLPAYTGGPVDPAVEERIQRVFPALPAQAPAP